MVGPTHMDHYWRREAEEQSRATRAPLVLRPVPMRRAEASPTGHTRLWERSGGTELESTEGIEQVIDLLGGPFMARMCGGNR